MLEAPMRLKTLLLSVFFVVACSGNDSSSDRDNQTQQLFDTTWVLESWGYPDGGQQPTSYLPYTLFLSAESNTANGRRNCNDYSGSYQISNQSIELFASNPANRCAYRNELTRIQNEQLNSMFNSKLTFSLSEHKLVLTSEAKENWVFSNRKFPAGDSVSPNGSTLSPEVADITDVHGVPAVPMDDSFSCVMAGVCTDPLIQFTDVGAYTRDNPELYAWKYTSESIKVTQIQYLASSQDSMESIMTSKRATRKEMVDSFAADHVIGPFGSVDGASFNAVQYLFVMENTQTQFPDCDPTRIAGEQWNTYYVVEIVDMDGTSSLYIQDPWDFETWYEGVCGLNSDRSPWKGIEPNGTIYRRLPYLYPAL